MKTYEVLCYTEALTVDFAISGKAIAIIRSTEINEAISSFAIFACFFFFYIFTEQRKTYRGSLCSVEAI
jgi:hypothetical protein